MCAALLTVIELEHWRSETQRTESAPHESRVVVSRCLLFPLAAVRVCAYPNHSSLFGSPDCLPIVAVVGRIASPAARRPLLTADRIETEQSGPERDDNAEEHERRTARRRQGDTHRDPRASAALFVRTRGAQGTQIKMLK